LLALREGRLDVLVWGLINTQTARELTQKMLTSIRANLAEAL